ncbi:MAG: hybrid sensor histidine kinase/response regulator, partial [Bacteroidetes bacterium]
MADLDNAYLSIRKHLGNRVARNLIFYLTCSLAFVLHTAFLHAQIGTIDFERVSAWHGYPNSYIEDIKEDRFGFLWFGTNEGLFRYDGYEFKVYRHDVRDSTTLSSPNIKDICETRNGELWIGTNSGLNLLDRRTGKFQRFLPGPQDEPTTKSTNLIRRVFEDSRGNLWLASLSAKNMLRFDRRSKQFIPTREVGKPGAKHFIRIFFEDSHGTVWAGTSFGLLKLNPGDSTFQHILPDPDPESENNRLIEQIREASDGSFWLATQGGLVNWNPDTQAIKNSYLPAGIENTTIKALILDRKGNPWFAIEQNGLGMYDIQQKQFSHFKYEANRNKSLNNNTVSCLFEDRFQNIWIGTANGISKIRRDHSGFELLLNVGIDGNIANAVSRVMRDSKGTLWTKTPEGVYAIPKGETQGKKIEELSLPETGGGGDWFLEDYIGNIWFSISGKGLYRRAANEKVFRKIYFGDSLSRVGIFKMIIDHKDKDVFWIGTTLGLCRLNWKTSERRWYEPMQDIPDISSNRFIIFDQYGDDEIWAYYTYSNSLGRFDKRTGKFELFRPDPANRAVLEGVIKDIAIGKDGNIWIANLYGLTNFNIPAKQFRIYGKREGMLENELQSVFLDKNEQVWVCGNRFFARLDQRRDTFYNYLVPKEALHFQTKAKHVATDGTISLGTINGIFSFHPGQIRKNPIAPNVVLTDFKVKTESYLLDQAFEDTKEIILPYHENDIAFEFSALHYINPQANKYKCRLIGFDKNWRDLGTEHKMNYTNLGPGQYTFQVIASNSDGVWNKDGLNIRLTITPAFWQTLWFKSLLVLMIVSIGYAIFKSRQYQMALKREKALAEQQAEYKTRFLAEVSHEIRTPMNAIIGLSNLALDTGPDGKLSKYISTIRQSSQNLLAIINDLLDHTKLEAGKFTLANKPFRLTEIVDQLNNNFRFKAEEKGLEFHLDTAFDKDTMLTGDPIRLLQILTNLLANAIKFTERGKVWLRVHETEGPRSTATIQFEVGDTGVGIPENQIETIFERFQQAGNHGSSA